MVRRLYGTRAEDMVLVVPGVWATQRINLAQNPEQVSTGNFVERQTRWSWVGSWVTQSWAPHGITTATRYTAPSSPPAFAGGVDFGGNADLSTPGTTGNWIAYPVTVGAQVTISASAKASTGVGFNILYRFHDGAGNWIGAAGGGSSFASGTEASVTVAAPTGAAYVVARIQLGAGTPVAGDWFEYTGILIEVGTSGAYFSGNTAASGLIRQAWTGTSNASTSIQQVVVGNPLTYGPPSIGLVGHVWTAATGGTQITDLLNSGGFAVNYVQQVSGFVLQFSGPDSAGSQATYWNSSLWLDFGLGFRVMLNPQPPIQADTGWSTLALPAGFTTDAGFAVPQYRIGQDGWVHLRGSAFNNTGGTIAAGTTLFTLPSTPNARPPATERFPSVLPAASGVSCYLQITNTGLISCDTALNADLVSLSGIRFTTNTLDY